MPFASSDQPVCNLAAKDRRWEDEIVYCVIIEKFSDGDPSNNVMKDQFAAQRTCFEGGFGEAIFKE